MDVVSKINHPLLRGLDLHYDILTAEVRVLMVFLIFSGSVENLLNFVTASTMSVLPIGSGGKMPHPTDTTHETSVITVFLLPLPYHTKKRKKI